MSLTGDEQTQYAHIGAGQGAAAGYKVGGPWGAVIGGIIGGVTGIFAGGKARKARLLTNKARKLERQVSYYDAAIGRRDMIRQARMARASSMAAASSESGGMLSSPTMGAVGSIGSQNQFNKTYFDSRIGALLTAQVYLDKAGKKAKEASDIMGLLSMATSVTGSFGGGGMGGMGGGSQSSPTSFGSPSAGYQSVSGSNMGLNYMGNYNPNSYWGRNSSTGWGIGG